MKTEQEQIEKMARSMCGYCSTDGKCAVSTNWREPDICANVDTQHCLFKEYAERLIESGYGKVSEYESEIEQLKAENDTNMQYIRMMGIQSHIKTSNEQVKQAKIDILNKLKERLYSIFVTKSSPLGDITVEDIVEDIDDLIEEVENETR